MNYDLNVTKQIIFLNLYLSTSKAPALKIYSKVQVPEKTT